MEEHVVICGDRWHVLIVKRHFIRNEGFPAMRAAFEVDAESHKIIVEKKNLVKNLAAAIEDVVLTKAGVVVPLVD